MLQQFFLEIDERNRMIIATLPLIVFFLAFSPFVISSSILSHRGGSAKRLQSESYPSHPNKFVSSSPLSVAAVCQNGVAFVALHTAHVTNEPLLLCCSTIMKETRKQGRNIERKTDLCEIENKSITKDRGEKKVILQDLPISTRGPLRIEEIDSYGSALLCAGWRTDGMMLAEKCREMASRELGQFGTLPYLDDKYGQFLARELNCYMASCVISGRVRALSSVVLLSTVLNVNDAEKSNEDNVRGGYLWLVDATGIYPIKAHAVGFGSNDINRRLVKESFEKLSVEEGAQLLLDIIVDEFGDRGDKNESRENWKLPQGTRVEIVALDSVTMKMRRLRQPFLA